MEKSPAVKEIEFLEYEIYDESRYANSADMLIWLSGEEETATPESRVEPTLKLTVNHQRVDPESLILDFWETQKSFRNRPRISTSAYPVRLWAPPLWVLMDRRTPDLLQDCNNSHAQSLLPNLSESEASVDVPTTADLKTVSPLTYEPARQFKLLRRLFRSLT